MNKTFTRISQIATGAAALATLLAGKAMALSSVQEGAELARAEGMPAELIGVDGILTKISNIILVGVGALSVIMLIYGGFRYIISGGDSKKVTDAKNTILYAIIGLIICILAYAIINFVISAVSTVSGTTPTV